MMFIFGSVSGDQDLGVVAELCPHCQVIAPCSVTGITQGVHVFFVPLAGGVTQAFCTCGCCGRQFPCKWWQYSQMVPATQAVLLTVEALLVRTNPALNQQVAWSKRREEFGSDPRFDAALKAVEELRTGTQSSKFMGDLKRWGALDESQRKELVQAIDQTVQNMQFAMSIASRIPRSDGWVIGVVACIAVWSASMGIPAVRENILSWGFAIGLVGVATGIAVFQFILYRRVRQWTQDILIPEGRDLHIDFGRFIEFLDELPESGRGSEDPIRDLQDQSKAIRSVISEFEVK